MYTLRNCSGLTLAATIASISSSDGQMSFRRDWLAVGVDAQHILLDIETDRAGNRIGDHQRRRGQESLLRIRMDTAVEVAVAGQHGGGIQIAVDDFLLDHRVQRAGHAVAGGAGKGDDAEAEFFQLRQQPGFFQIQAPRPSIPAPANSSPTACGSGRARWRCAQSARRQSCCAGYWCWCSW